MKRIHLKLVFLNVFFFTCLLFSFISCSKDNVINSEILITCDDGIQNGNETGIDCGGSCSNECPLANALEGTLITRLVLHPNIDYILTGPLVVRDGAILEMEAGTLIKALSNKNAFIAVAQGGKIYIWGTEENPVVITSASENPAPGDWGGLVICGNAPSNNGANSRSELVDFFYSGNENTDTSGVIKYLRLEYTGEKFRDSKRFNGITFYGVGSFTTIEHIQTYQSLGNGFEFVGGTLNAKWLVSKNSHQNSVSIKDGWTGKGDYWYLKDATNANIILTNNKSNQSATPITNGTLKNLSIINTTEEGAFKYTEGGGIFNITEVYSSNITLGINIIGDQETSMVENGNLNISTIQFDNPANGFIATNFSGSTTFYSEGNSLGAGNGALQPGWAINWTIGF